MKKSELLFSAILVPVDYFMVFVAGLLAYNLRFGEFFSEIRPIVYEIVLKEYVAAILIVSGIFVVIFALTGLYSIKGNKKIIDEISKIFVATTASVALIIILIFFQRELFSSRFIILAGWILSFMLATLGRIVVRTIQRTLIKKGIGVHYTLIIGNDKLTDDLISQIHKQPELGYKIIGRCSDFSQSSKDEILTKLEASPIDEIIQADASLPRNENLELKEFCHDHHITFKYLTDLVQTPPVHIDISTIADIPIIEVRRTKLDGWGRILKRAFDIFVSSLLLIVLSPLLLIVAILIKIDSQGPVFVKLERIGEKEKRFVLFKFRSMVKNAQALKDELVQYNERQDGPLFKIKNDPRITRMGRLIRKLSIDELPQFINVFIGKMSLVGPRPHEPEEVAKYERWQKKLLAIKPGVTGLAQISGRSDLKFEDEAKLDIYYIENWSPKIDFHILFKTPWVVISGKSAA